MAFTVAPSGAKVQDPMMQHQLEITIAARGQSLIEITGEVREFVRGSGPAMQG